MENREKMTTEELEAATSRLLRIITSHVGKTRSIGMGELYQKVFPGKSWHHRINDTRTLRKLITDLRKEGVPICSDAARTGGGYYLAAAGSEGEAYCRRLRYQGIRKLMLEARIRKISLEELLGQAQLELTGTGA